MSVSPQAIEEILTKEIDHFNTNSHELMCSIAREIILVRCYDKKCNLDKINPSDYVVINFPYLYPREGKRIDEISRIKFGIVDDKNVGSIIDFKGYPWYSVLRGKQIIRFIIDIFNAFDIWIIQSHKINVKVKFNYGKDTYIPMTNNYMECPISIKKHFASLFALTSQGSST